MTRIDLGPHHWVELHPTGTGSSVRAVICDTAGQRGKGWLFPSEAAAVRTVRDAYRRATVPPAARELGTWVAYGLLAIVALGVMWTVGRGPIMVAVCLAILMFYGC